MTSLRARLDRHRFTALVLLSLVVAIGLLAWQAGGVGTSEALDPDNPGRDGGRALARVAADQGLEVVVARGAEQLRDETVGPGTTVLVTSAEQLGPSTVDDLLDHARQGQVVIASPPNPVLEHLGVRLPERRGLDEPAAAGCADPRFADLTVRADVVQVFRGDGCFHSGRGVLLHSPTDGLWLWGAAGALDNEQVLASDNAAVALRLVGAGDRLVWYVPSATDLSGEDALSLGSLLPPWLVPALWLVAGSAVGLVLWRGRRLGPLAVEPLPVTVRSTETVASRGRLYRRSGDRAHAAAALRAATRRRLRHALRLPDGPDPAPVADRYGVDRAPADGASSAAGLVGAVARHTGRPADEVRDLLDDTRPPTTDDHLVGLARALAELEEEVRRR